MFTGSFRLAARTRHLHRDCTFTEPLVETAPKSLRHSCRAELRVDPPLSGGADYPFTSPRARRSTAVGLVVPTTSIGSSFLRRGPAYCPPPEATNLSFRISR